MTTERHGHFVDFHEWRCRKHMSVWIGPPELGSKSGIASPHTFELLPVIKSGKDHPAGNLWEPHETLDDLRTKCHRSDDQVTLIPGYAQAVLLPRESVVVPFSDRPTAFRPGPPEIPRPMH